MTKKRKMAILIPAVALAVVIGGLGPLVGPPIIIAFQVNRAQIRLLRETDHHALLDACRELSRLSVGAEFKGEVYKGAEIRSLPEPIPALRPDHVTIGRDGLVKIGMYAGWYDLGIRWYPENYPEYPPPFKYGDRKLLEGLWYYDEGYRTDPEGYNKVIDTLLMKNRKAEVTSRGPGSDSNDPGGKRLRSP